MAQQLSGSAVGADATATFAWDLNGDTIFETLGATATFSAAARNGPGSQSITLQVCNAGSACATDGAVVNIASVAPTLGAITAPLDPVQLAVAVNTSATFTDPGVLDTHTASWDWGDGTTSAGAVSENNGSGSVSGSHTYTQPGVYVVGLTVTDNDGAIGTATYQYVVVYDPQGGFVTGAGSIDSPAGAYLADPTLSGQAQFGFVSRYVKGATLPQGQTSFRFRAADLNFDSASCEWLVVAGTRAQFKGSGTINDQRDYGFLLSVVDGGKTGLDRFRIKIWDRATGAVVYDNQMGALDNAEPATTIQTGSIVIHK